MNAGSFYVVEYRRTGKANPMVTLSLFIFSYATSMIFPPQQRFLRTPYRDRTHFCILNQSITLQTALQLFLGHRIHSAKRQPATAYVHPHRIHGTFYGNGIDITEQIFNEL